MPREQGYIYVLAVGENAELIDGGLRDAYCTGFESSVDGKLGFIRIPTSIRVLSVPSGMALRLPSALGARLVQGPRFRTITAEEFYSRGRDIPDGYALAEEAEELAKEIRGLKRQIKALKKTPAAAAEPEAEPETPAGVGPTDGE